MSQEEEFNPWKWDRKQYMAGKSRLTVERHGHEVTLDHQGVSIDGKRIVRDNPGHGEHGFQVTELGTVLYRGKEIAAIDPPANGTANPGEVTVYGANGPGSREKREREEAERQQRDDRYRASEQHHHQHEVTRGQEMTL